MNYGNRLMLLRERIGLTKIQVAEILSISDSLYSRYEKEKQTIPIKHLNILCNYFNVSIDYILGFSNTKSYKNSREDINLEFSSIRLKNLLKDNDMNQKELSFLLNVEPSTISKYVTGKCVIAISYLYTICKKYKISADYLLGKIDYPKYLD